MPIDWQRALERADELKAQGYSPQLVNQILSEEQAAADAKAQEYGHANAAEARTSLQQARSSMNADAISPGQEPDTDPVESAIAAGQAAGPRGSQAAFNAFTSRLFEAAAKGDPRVASEGTTTSEQRDQWMADANHRQIANRGKSGFTHR